MTRKWRPKLWYVIFLVLGLVLCLPIAGLFLFKFYANQLVQQTEESLIGQASILVATYAELYDQIGPPPPIDLPVFAGSDAGRFAPVFPALSLAKGSILPPRPEAVTVAVQPLPHYLEIGDILSKVSEIAQQQTLVGYRILDHNGTVIGGSAELGVSLAAVHEVQQALAGEISAVARLRLRNTPDPLVYRLSRGTKLRVFVALPVVVDGYVVGAVYLSRTPNHIFRFFYGERVNLLKAMIFVLLATGLIGLVFWRFITQPIHALIKRTKMIDQNGFGNSERSDHFGTREIENLSQSFEIMTKNLQKRQDAISNFTAHVTHELKSPLTSVKGAAELMLDSGADMSADQHNRFLENIITDTTRMEDLLRRMRVLAQAEQPHSEGNCRIGQIQTALIIQTNGLQIDLVNKVQDLPIHADMLTIILKHLIENASEHGASKIILTAGQAGRIFLDINDNGSGISRGNREKIMVPFFTTRRDCGGTGMGLNIVKSMLETMGAQIELTDPASGAGFRIWFPIAAR